MIKRTLFFANPVYLSTKDEQMLVNYPDKSQETKQVPIEDIGIVILENQQITITNGLLDRLVQNKTAIIQCNAQHLPSGLMLPMAGHSEQTERHLKQLSASVPLKKNLWQQTVTAKILNQARHLESRNIPHDNMLYWAKSVTSGDSQNHEARAAAYYWQNIFSLDKFNRKREGEPPNHLLNYGYAILRAITARALVGSGLLPMVGIFHRSKYNAYCLADDIMEPYRPFVDKLVAQIIENEEVDEKLETRHKLHLLGIATVDVVIEGKSSPLMVAMSRTSNSLQECFEGSNRKIIYPDYV